MTSMLPTLQAADLRRALIDYLGTTFALADEDVRGALDEFLTHPDAGVFRGPYVRLRLPFRPADGTWSVPLDWYPDDFGPYGHQARAFERLSSKQHEPRATLITTGTGSGKTESFLFPIIDHALRRRRDGQRGIKALVLYPMNALANDQALRLAKLLTSDTRLQGLTAALYTGEQTGGRTTVGPEALITDRAVIRDDPPDILLTNYKMLDQLLLRGLDAKLWRESRESLQYLVLDEFHTYDGAQGTDVAMLLRRLGLVLGVNEPGRPLGRITPVATSATLGSNAAPEAMLNFAATVFGGDFEPDAVITEERLGASDWVASQAGDQSTGPYRAVGAVDVPAIASRLLATAPHEAVAELVGSLFVRDDNGADQQLSPQELDRLTRSRDLPALVVDHPLTQRLLAHAERPMRLYDLASELFPGDASEHHRDGVAVIDAYVGLLSMLRADVGLSFVSVDVQLWMREVTRVDRSATAPPEFRWADDGVQASGELHLPAIYCRHCGRSGWAVVLAPTGRNLDTDDSRIRHRRLGGDDRFRALIYAPGEAAVADVDRPTDELRWFDTINREILTSRPDADAESVDHVSAIPVLVDLADADGGSRKDTCPACGLDDGIRFLGTSIATLTSVSLSTLFGASQLDPREKKTLIFTDSVQDAAHRAGFVQARSHTLSLRSALRRAVADTEQNLTQLTQHVLADAGDDPYRRYALIAPALLDRERFTSFWSGRGDRTAQRISREFVERRLAFDIALEFGLHARTGRTLELTGSIIAEVAAGSSDRLGRLGAASILQSREQNSLAFETSDPTFEFDQNAVVGWVRGVLERVRTRGGISHRWLNAYIQADGNRYTIWGGRPRDQGMPAFPTGRPAPAFPTTTRGIEGFDTITSAQSWYALWAVRALSVTARDGAILTRDLLARLAADRILDVTTTASGALVYTIPPDAVVISAPTDADLESGLHTLRCEVCQTVVPGTRPVIDQLLDGPCLAVRCTGRLHRDPRGPDYYRDLYASSDMRRVVAAEHTSLLKPADRLAREEGFKNSTTPADPNVLVATPTLELGIDIGDLSMVMLASLPRSVAAYLQRVGRAGRLTGNALVLAYISGRGRELPRLAEPLSVIDGDVRPPATYLDAAEILQRQYVAHLLDRRAQQPNAASTEPRRARDVLDSWEPGTWTGDVLTDARANASRYVEEFLAQFDDFVRADTADVLRQFAGVDIADGESSGLERLLRRAIVDWHAELDELYRRRQSLTQALPELQQRAEQPAATKEDQRAYRASQSEQKLLSRRIGDLETKYYWIQALEEQGVLPNYTLLDDSVTLDIGLRWIDQDTGDWREEPRIIQRGSRSALTEFAPGATFYSQGSAVVIDAVDAGRDAAEAQTWQCCAACGWIVARPIDSTDVEDLPDACPRCNDGSIRDTGQRLDVLPLTRVSAQVSRDDVVISDANEDRERLAFTVVTAADIDPAQISSAWRLTNYSFGAEYIRQLDIRWLNVGRTAQSGTDRFLAGQQVQTPLFRVCPGCGVVPAAQRRDEQNARHRGWCAHRNALTVPWRDLALARSLRTQAVRLLVPPQFLLDNFAADSFRAALLLGLREIIGGDPDHLEIVTVHAGNTVAMLLHDIVPGGTGYLADFARPSRVRELLAAAALVLRECPCADEGRLSCHRCLLPFAIPSRVEQVSRARGLQILDDILNAGHDADSPGGQEPGQWSTETTTSVIDIPAPSTESYLEQRFRTLLVTALRSRGVTVQEEPQVHGSVVHITMPGTVTRRWALRPQVLLDGVCPDFVLTTQDPGIPQVCIFTDGLRFHAVPDCNRIADDAAKRAALRDRGSVVWAITSHDLDRFEATEDGAGDDWPSWLTPEALNRVRTSCGAGSADPDLLLRDAVTQLLDWLRDPNPIAWERLAAVLPLAFAAKPGSAHAAMTDTSELPRAAYRALAGEPVYPGEGPTPAWWWKSAHGLVVSAALVSTSPVAVDTVLAVDDTAAALASDPGQRAWREWLQVSTVLGFSRQLPLITCSSLLAAGAPTDSARRVTAEVPDETLSAGWQVLIDAALDDDERQLLLALAGLGVVYPEQGYETPSGIPIDMVWEDERLAVVMVGDDGASELVAQGWTVLPPDPERIAAYLSTAAVGTNG